MFRHLAFHDFFHAYRIEELLLKKEWTERQNLFRELARYSRRARWFPPRQSHMLALSNSSITIVAVVIATPASGYQTWAWVAMTTICILAVRFALQGELPREPLKVPENRLPIALTDSGVPPHGPATTRCGVSASPRRAIN
jgi:hypothetical protein